MPLTLPAKTIQRNRLWFDRYDHMARIFLPEACCLRTLDHDRINRVLDAREHWGQKLIVRNPGSWVAGWEKLTITNHMRESLHAMADFLLARSGQYKLTLSGDCLYIYSTSPQLMLEIRQLSWLDQERMSFSQVQLSGPAGAVLLKEPVHAWRSYLRGRLVDEQLVSRLSRLLDTSPATGSRSLQESLRRGWSRFHDYYYIDYDDPSFLTMLALISPGLVRKTLPIIQHK